MVRHSRRRGASESQDRVRWIAGKWEQHCYLISTDGSVHGHPDDEAMTRILAYGGNDDKVLHVNCWVDQTEKWNDQELRNGYKYRPRYPPRGRAGLAVNL